MPPFKLVSAVLATAALAAAVGCSSAGKTGTTTPVAAPGTAIADEAAMPLDARHIQQFVNTGNVGDPLIGRHMFNDSVARLNPWQFKNNGRSCASCHIGSDGFGLGRQSAYNAGPNSPLITALLADGDPDVDFNSPQGQKLKRVMLDQLRECGLIRIVLPNPNFVESEGETDENPRFIRTWRSVPTVFNSGLGIQEDHGTSHGDLFGAFIMWDGREPSLEHQAASATMGHAQTLLQIPKNVEGAELRAKVTSHTGADIARFEKDALSLPRELGKRKILRPQVDHRWDGTPFEGAPVFEMATVQKQFFSTVKLTTEAQKRGMKLFVQNKGKPACITCHNLPETLAGGTRLFASADIAEENSISRLHKASPELAPLLHELGFQLDDDSAITDAHSGNDMLQRQRLPKFKLRLKDQDGGWHVVTTPDPGLAGQTGRYEDFQKFKIPQLRGIKSFTRFFHENHDTLNLMAVVQHYDNVLESLEFTPQEQSDVVEFLKAL